MLFCSANLRTGSTLAQALGRRIRDVLVERVEAHAGAVGDPNSSGAGGASRSDELVVQADVGDLVRPEPERVGSGAAAFVVVL